MARNNEITEVRKSVVAFVNEELGKEGLPVSVIEIRKVDEAPVSWIAKVQVVEENDYIKALGLGTTVYDRNIYELSIDENLDILSFNKAEQHDGNRTAPTLDQF